MLLQSHFELWHVLLLKWTQVAHIEVRHVVTRRRQPTWDLGMLITILLVLLGDGLLLERPLEDHVFARLAKIDGGRFVVVEGRRILAALAQTGCLEIMHLAYFG